MIRPTVARIDLDALKSNYRRIVEYLAAEAGDRRPGVIAVVRANAYGHGAGQVALALEEAGADLLACADIEEGQALREAGVGAEILVFGALSVSDLDGLFDCRLTPTISTPGAARAVQEAPRPDPRGAGFHRGSRGTRAHLPLKRAGHTGSVRGALQSRRRDTRATEGTE